MFEIRINQHRNESLCSGASAALFAQSDDLPLKSQNHSTAPDARRIVDSSIAPRQRSWQARFHYTYVEVKRIGAGLGWTREVGVMSMSRE
jgi:hypothetical protein